MCVFINIEIVPAIQEIHIYQYSLCPSVTFGSSYPIQCLFVSLIIHLFINSLGWAEVIENTQSNR